MRFRCVLLALLALLVVVPVSSAHPPSSVSLQYAVASDSLSVTISHDVSGQASHYIYKVEIYKNNVLVKSEEYSSQPGNSLTYEYQVGASSGDSLKATAYCNLAGSGSAQLTVSGSGGSVTAPTPQIWPYHAAPMVLGLLLLIASSYFITKPAKKKNWWLKAHKLFGSTGAILAISGLAVAVYMVSVSGSGHFRVPHAFLGATALLLALLSPVLGYLRFRYLSRPKIRTAHVWLGLIAIVLMAANVFSGLILAGAL